MELISIIALIAGAVGLIGGNVGNIKKIYDKFKTGGVNVNTAKEVWEQDGATITEFVKEVEELIQQGMVMSKAVDKQKTAVERIAQEAELRKALIEAAQKYGPEALEALSKVLTPVPREMEALGGIELDKLTKLKEAQREGLNKKEAFNKILGDSGQMARSIVSIVKHVAPVISKVK